MMESLKTAVLSACMLGCGAGLVSMISPGKSMERQMHFLVSLLFAVGLMAAFTQFELPSDPGILAQEMLEEQTQAMDERIRTALLEQTKTGTEEAIRRKLEENGIHCTAVEATLHIDADNCIHISKVTVTCDDFAGANALLPDLLGEEAEICVTQILPEMGSP